MLNILVLSGGKGNRINKLLNHGCKALTRFDGEMWINTLYTLFKTNFYFNFDIFLNINADHSKLEDVKLIDRSLINIIVESKREGVLNGIIHSSKFLKNNKYTLVILGDVIFQKQFVVFVNNILNNPYNENDIIAIGRPKRDGKDYEIFSKNNFTIDQDLQVGGALICSTEKLQKLVWNKVFVSSFYEIVKKISEDRNLIILNYTGLFEDFGTEIRYKNITKI
tara:strand:- start:708 stop:1376 length:669 start_codon:yes stop_codon:yes gene_type:complete